MIISGDSQCLQPSFKEGEKGHEDGGVYKQVLLQADEGQHQVRVAEQYLGTFSNKKLVIWLWLFRKLEGFSFIFQPEEFDASHCRGRCPPRYHPLNDHSLLQVRQTNNNLSLNFFIIVNFKISSLSFTFNLLATRRDVLLFADLVAPLQNIQTLTSYIWIR